MVLEYEKSLAHWKHLTNRKEILVNWIETAEAKANESIELKIKALTKAPKCGVVNFRKCG